MEIFSPGTKLRTRSGSDIEIVKHLAGGRQGNVYIVEYGGKKKALKWYKNGVLIEPDKFYDNLVNNVAKGSPDKSFLWPQAVTEKKDGSFGYIMDIRPEGYVKLSLLLLARHYDFRSYKTAAHACIKIVSSFRILHNKGLCYQDINADNIFINPVTGDVLICDNDNVSPDLTDMGVMGTVRFMAPEIIAGGGDVLPDIKSDLYALATVLFMILFKAHPLEGKKWFEANPLTPERESELYGKCPLFIFDPIDKSNAPGKKRQSSVIRRWELMPEYIKNMFITAFSSEALRNPDARPLERDWLPVLTRFMCDIARCPCGNDVFIKSASDTPCDNENCDHVIQVEHSIKLPLYTISALEGSRIFRCQLGMCNVEEALSPVFLIVPKEDDPTKLGVVNMTDRVIDATTPSGAVRTVVPGQGVPIISGITLTVFDKTIVFN